MDFEKNFDKKFRQMKKYFSEQEKKIRESQVKQFTFFILGFVLFYWIITGLVGLFPGIWFKTMVGLPSEILLNIQGVDTTSIIEEDFVINITSNGTRIIVSDWCAGTMEIIILSSAILASFGVAWKKKGYGIVAGIITGYVFNIFRIWTTVNIILTQSIEVADFTHDTLFRIMLFVYITGFYVAWFWWSENGLPKQIIELLNKAQI